MGRKKIFWVASLFELDEVNGAWTRAGFAIEHAEIRDPYDFGYPTRWVYILARKPPPVSNR